MPARVDTSNQPEQLRHPLQNLYFYLTEGCNLKCRHCWIAPKYQAPTGTVPSLSVDLFKSIISQAKPLGLSAVKLTGGEPLLHPEIFELLDVVNDEGLRLTVETNGVLCTPELAAKLKSTGERPFVSVSLDGTDAETHEWVRGVPGSFDGAIQGIRNLVEAGFRPQLIMSIMRRNRDQMEPLVRLAEQLGAGSVKFNIVQPTSRGEKMHAAAETLTLEELIETGAWVEKTLSASTSLTVVYHHPPAFRPLGNIFGEEASGGGRCGINGILGVLSSGSYALCGIGEAIPELIFGDASKDRLEDVWNGAPALQELRDGLPGRLTGVCGECVMNSLCLGNCVAQNYYSNRDLWSSFWYCEEARSKGLFPESRLRPKQLA
jgi:SynChlorMet cassette radical SAM/SPASM protein ScmF